MAQCSKIRKKFNFRSTKTHFLQFQKWLKIDFFFAQEKSLKLKKCNFKLFSGAKIDFSPIFEIAKKCIFFYF